MSRVLTYSFLSRQQLASTWGACPQVVFRHGLCLDSLHSLQALLNVTVIKLLSPVLSIRASSFLRAELVSTLLCPLTLGLKLTLGLGSVAESLLRDSGQSQFLQLESETTAGVNSEG